MPFISPKRHATRAGGKASWYNYYAGYTPSFVRAAIEELSLAEGSRILDPWNGSGTTTEVADESGFAAIGYDINPVMVMVAKARLLPQTVKPSHHSLCQNILALAKSDYHFALDQEPLERWFQPDAARRLRNVEVAIKQLFVPGTCRAIGELPGLSNVSSLSAFFYIALFRVCRQLTADFGTSNPTWLTVPEPKRRRRPSWSTIVGLFQKNINEMALAQWNGSDSPRAAARSAFSTSSVDLASSTSLPIADESIEAVISSPPYCTRIDYAVATRIELAVLGVADLRPLRRAMIGSAVINIEVPTQHRAWGVSCNKLLNRIAGHPAKASASYYLKNHLQYFDGLYRSIKEIDRTLRPSGQCVMVVQDSYYKDIHNDLPRIVVEMGNGRNWRLERRMNFASIRNMGRVNPRSRLYRHHATATESVLHFRKLT